MGAGRRKRNGSSRTGSKRIAEGERRRRDGVAGWAWSMSPIRGVKHVRSSTGTSRGHHWMVSMDDQVVKVRLQHCQLRWPWMHFVLTINSKLRFSFVRKYVY